LKYITDSVATGKWQGQCSVILSKPKPPTRTRNFLQSSNVNWGELPKRSAGNDRPRRPEVPELQRARALRIGTGVRSATKHERGPSRFVAITCQNRLRAKLIPGPDAAAAPGDSAKPRSRQRRQIGRSLDMNPEKPCFRQGRMRRGIKLLSPHPELASLLELLLELEDRRIAQPIRPRPDFLESNFQRQRSTTFFHIVGTTSLIFIAPFSFSTWPVSHSFSTVTNWKVFLQGF
jgi:hypothetical protein